MKAAEINEWKDKLDKAAESYVTNHKDGEVRRMFGHHYRSFRDGAIWEREQSASLVEENKKLREALEHLVVCLRNESKYNKDVKRSIAVNAAVQRANSLLSPTTKEEKV